jgi:hypothetical protein
MFRHGYDAEPSGDPHDNTFGDFNNYAQRLHHLGYIREDFEEISAYYLHIGFSCAI